MIHKDDIGHVLKKLKTSAAVEIKLFVIYIREFDLNFSLKENWTDMNLVFAFAGRH